MNLPYTRGTGASPGSVGSLIGFGALLILSTLAAVTLMEHQPPAWKIYVGLALLTAFTCAMCCAAIYLRIATAPYTDATPEPKQTSTQNPVHSIVATLVPEGVLLSYESSDPVTGESIQHTVIAPQNRLSFAADAAEGQSYVETMRTMTAQAPGALQLSYVVHVHSMDDVEVPPVVV